MTNIKEQIRAEIEQLYDGEAPKHDQQCDFDDGYFTGIAAISKFIDSLSEEKPEKSEKDCNGCSHCVDRKDQYGWHFKGCIGGPYNGKFIAEIDECPLKLEQPSKSLEEVAEKYADKHGFRVPYDGSNNYYDDVDVKASKEGFLAGAEWQKKQDTADMLKSDFTVFNKCYEQGRDDMKEQMLKDAVERVVKVDAGGYPYIDTTELYDYEKDKPLAKADDKIKVIIVKKEDEK